MKNYALFKYNALYLTNPPPEHYFSYIQKCAVNGKLSLKNVLSKVNFQMLFQLLVVFRKEAAWDRYYSLSTLTTCQIASTLVRRECLLMTPV